MAKDRIFTVQSPESSGISSSSILRFINRIEREHVCLHGFIILRHAKIVAEGYWTPYHVDRLNRMYSVSKSFVSLAIGLMVSEGKISLNDQVYTYFPDKIPAKLHPYIKRSTIRNLLMMASPYETDSYTVHDNDWAWTFFNREPSHLPGMVFSYDTSATDVLVALVERLSGMPFLEYLRPGLLDPIGFSKDAWCIKTPEGTSFGGSGVMCTLRDMAKVALVCMNKGRWNGTQLIPAEYVTAATSKQIDNSIIYGRHGYGYQIWCEKDEGFSFRGMGSQLAYCMPGKDFLFACIADTQGDGPTGTGVENAMWQEIYERLSDRPLPEDPQAFSQLKEKISGLEFIPLKGQMSTSMVPRVSGVLYKMQDNPMGITDMRFNFGDSEGNWEYTNAQGQNCLRFGIGRYVADVFPQKNYFGPQIGLTPGIPYECLSSAAWVEENKLNVIVYITDNYLGTLKMTVVFLGDEITIYMTKVAEWFLNEYQGFASGIAISDQHKLPACQ